MESGSLNRRRRAGKYLLAVGAVIVGVVVLLLSAGLVSAMTGYSEMIQGTAPFLVPILLIGLLLVMVGVLVYILPEGYSREAVWAWKTGPFR